jgi:carbonic anhydrase/acetyltransferase-like protein (isoleucine patch superfamily)
MSARPDIRAYRSKWPRIAPSAYIDRASVIIGDVVIGEDASVWPMCVARGDVHYIRIGKRSNIQDGCVLHVTGGGVPLEVGAEVTVGHRAILHGARIEDRCLIGMGSVLMDGCVIGEESLVGAGSVVLEGTRVPPRSFIAGVPAKVKGPIPPPLHARLRESAAGYVRLAREHATLRDAV